MDDMALATFDRIVSRHQMAQGTDGFITHGWGPAYSEDVETLLKHIREQAAEIERLGKDKLAGAIGYSVYRNRAEAAEAALVPLRAALGTAEEALEIMLIPSNHADGVNDCQVALAAIRAIPRKVLNG